MIKVTEKNLCCGCSACVCACPKNCIRMEIDAEGFSYPVVNGKECIQCGKCESVCPISTCLTPEHSVPRAYIVQDKRVDVRETSSSGGAFSGIAEYVIEVLHGDVYGATFDSFDRVIHCSASSVEEIHKFRGSKYIQSDVNGIFCEIKNKLIHGRYILFSGTPCQVAGLKKYLGETFDNLITLDLACHGVASPLVYKKYCDYWEQKEREKLVSVEFRSKEYGYSGSTMKLSFANGHTYTNGRMLQFHKNTMFAGLSLRPSCHNCKFKTIERVSDFTLFDCWDVQNFDPSFDDDKGTTSVLVHTQVGEEIVSKMLDKWKIVRVDAEVLIRNDGDMITLSAHQNPNRDQFFRDINEMELQEVNRKYFPCSLRSIMVFFLKPILGKTRLLKRLKRIFT